MKLEFIVENLEIRVMCLVYHYFEKYYNPKILPPMVQTVLVSNVIERVLFDGSC